MKLFQINLFLKYWGNEEWSPITAVSCFPLQVESTVPPVIMKLPRAYARGFVIYASSGVKSLRSEKSLRFDPQANAWGFSRRGIKNRLRVSDWNIRLKNSITEVYDRKMKGSVWSIYFNWKSGYFRQKLCQKLPGSLRCLSPVYSLVSWFIIILPVWARQKKEVHRIKLPQNL